MILGFFSLLSKSRRDMARRMHLASPQALAGKIPEFEKTMPRGRTGMTESISP